jgi:hypothetical protein
MLPNEAPSASFGLGEPAGLAAVDVQGPDAVSAHDQRQRQRGVDPRGGG